MTYAIFRIEKIKSWKLLAAASGHINRSIPTPNADPGKENPILIGTDNPASDVRAHILEAGLSPDKLRKNGVIGVRILVTASPEYFRPLSVSRAGTWDPERLDRWLAVTKNFLAKEFGENLVSATLHLDESTPHIDGIFVPVDRATRKKGPSVRLNCARWFDGKEKLIAMQDRYAAALEPLGLRRGIKGSRARHQDIKRMYSTLHQEAEAAKTKTQNAAISLALADNEYKKAASERTQAFRESENIRAMRFGLEAFAEGTIIRTSGTETSPTFELRKMPPSDAHQIRSKLKPAWRAVWKFIRNIEGQIQARARAIASNMVSLVLQKASHEVAAARIISRKAKLLQASLSPQQRATSDELATLLKKSELTKLVSKNVRQR